jgi:hypothetical protein
VPRVTITLTDESIYLTRHDRNGAPAATYPVSAASVANAFNEFGADTGLLPPGTLFWQSHGGQLRIGVWLLPSRRTITIRTGNGVEQWTIPLPGSVFVGNGRDYRIYAARSMPLHAVDRVYHCPLPNVYDDGRICPGNVPFPKCGPETMNQAIELFFESEFNRDLDGQETLTLLASLRGKRVFPLEQLHAAMTIGDVIAGRTISEYNNWREDEEGIDPYEFMDGVNDDDDQDL